MGIHDRGEVTDGVGRAVIAYVRRAAGETGVARLLEMVGEELWLEDTDRPDFVDGGATVTLTEAAGSICGDPDIARRIGEEAFRINRGAGLTDFLQATGSPAQAIAICADVATKYSVSKVNRVLAQSDHGVTVEARTVPGYRPHRLSCGMCSGYWAEVPSLFGLVGTVIEPECELRGDDRCLIEVSWTGAVDTPSAQADQRAAAVRASGAMARFEQFQAMAGQLASSADVDDALDRIVSQATTTVLAPRFVLAVRLSDDQELKVHCHGMSAAEAAECVELLEQNPDDDRFGAACVVRVGSGRRDYGMLAALQSRGSVVNELDRRLLGAYAGFAAGFLETAAALELAKRERDAALALLELAEALGQVHTPDEVADRLVRAVPRVTGSDQAGFWEIATGPDGPATLRLVASYSPANPELPTTLPLEIGQQLAAGLSMLTEITDPYFFELATVPNGALAMAMRARGLEAAGLMPVRVRGRLAGVLSAGFRSPGTGRPPELMDRLHALAELGAQALDNAELLEQVRQQALHDPLTGLSNRRLAEETVNHELARAARGAGAPALLFVDIDRLKAVNDGFGHAAGDALLVELAERLVSSVRESDHVSRLSGDEFLVIVPDCDGPDDAVRVAERVLTTIQDPFTINGRQLLVSASIGIALYPQHGRDFATLLLNADTAMYRAKFAGRNGWSFDDAGGPVPPRAEDCLGDPC